MKSISQVAILCLTLAVSPAPAQQQAQPVGKPLDLGRAVHAHVFHSQSGALKGAIIGFPIGVFAGVTLGAEACLHRPKWHCAVGGGLTYSALGALIGWLH